MWAPSKQAISLIFNFFAAIFIILINKAVFAKVAFNWPGALTLLHYLVTYGSLAVMRSFGAFEASTKPMTRRMWWLALVVGVTPCVNNMALEANSVGMYQVRPLRTDGC
jgi:solute carrier family 35 protein E3